MPNSQRCSVPPVSFNGSCGSSVALKNQALDKQIKDRVVSTAISCKWEISSNEDRNGTNMLKVVALLLLFIKVVSELPLTEMQICRICGSNNFSKTVLAVLCQNVLSYIKLL